MKPARCERRSFSLKYSYDSVLFCVANDNLLLRNNIPQCHDWSIRIKYSREPCNKAIFRVGFEWNFMINMQPFGPDAVIKHRWLLSAGSLRSAWCVLGFTDLLLSCSHFSTLHEDLKLSSSEDSDGEQDPAKNASRNNSTRWHTQVYYHSKPQFIFRKVLYVFFFLLICMA